MANIYGSYGPEWWQARDWEYGPGPARRRRRGISGCGGCLIMALLFFFSLTVVGLLLTRNLQLGGGLGSAGAAGAGAAPAPGVARRLDPGLVDVVSTLGYQDAQAAGTGLVLTSSGEILTNNHVIDGATSVSVTDIANGRTYTAIIVGYDIEDDVAVLQLRDASGLRTVRLGDSSTVTVGQRVTAVGNAGGRGGTPTVASGTVTGLDAAIIATNAGENTTEHLRGLIRTDVRLEPGDSGGPLYDQHSLVIGVNTAATTGFELQQSGSMGFAIPINRALSLSEQIVAGQSSADVHIGPTGFLGVQLLWKTTGGSSGKVPVVVGVLPGTPASRAGLGYGDVLLSVGGRSEASQSAVQADLSQFHPGDRVSVRWLDPHGVTHRAVLVLASGPAD
jgi:S1-C subfamily serine protease